MIKIREEQPKDYLTIKEINDIAFGQPQESNIINKLRQNCNTLLSLVAIDNEKIVGHIMFSQVTIELDKVTIYGMGIAPMSVIPEYQRKGIGSKLIKEGINILKNKKCLFIVVLGHPEYYPRFGFEKASSYNIKCQWDGIPEEAFMILVLEKEAVTGGSGTAKYREEFNDEM